MYVYCNTHTHTHTHTHSEADTLKMIKVVCTALESATLRSYINIQYTYYSKQENFKE